MHPTAYRASTSPGLPVLSIRLVLLLLCLAAPAVASAQSAASVAAGTAHLQAGRFAEAARVFRAVTEREPANGIAWYRLGMALQEAGDEAGAIPALERAAELGFQAPYARARIARAHAALGRPERALAVLDSASTTGLDAPQLLEHDAFAAFDDDARFASILARVRRNADPCAHGEEYHALDFWIGEWDVYDPAGQKVGENRVTPLLDSCALRENWRDARGSEGKSLNLYDRTTGLWRQLWVTDRGNVMDYAVGRAGEGVMEFEGEVSLGGDTIRRRMVFTAVAPDTVTQQIDQSTDGGGSWTPSWTGIYVRRAAPAEGALDRDLADALEDLRSRYLRAYNQGDADAMAALYVDEAVRMPYDAPPQSSAADIVDAYRATFRSRGFDPVLTFAVDELIVEGDVVVERGRYREEIHPRSGAAPLLEEGKYIAVLRRDADGGWRYAWSIFNRDGRPGPLGGG